MRNTIRAVTIAIRRLVMPLLLVLSPSLIAGDRDSNAFKPLAQSIHHTWQTEDGLPQNSISSIIQTRDGYLWLATLEGLVRFDGVHFDIYDRSTIPELQSNRILSLLEDSRGTLWIGTEGGGLTRMRNGRFASFSMAQGKPFKTVTSLCEDRTGALWMGTDADGVVVLKDEHFTILNKESGFPLDGAGPIAEDEAGAIWIGADEGLARYLDGEMTIYTTRDGLPGDNVMSLVAARDGSMWIGTTSGLSHFRDERFVNYSVKDGLTNDFIWSLHEGKDGSLFIGTQGGGVCCLKEGVLSSFSTRDGLSNDVIWSLFQDRESNLWVGTNGGGVNQLRDGIFASYGSREGLSNEFVWSICEAPDASLWVGTYNGLNHLVNDRFVTYSERDGLSNNFIWSVFVDSRANVWVGTNRGLNLYRDGKFRVFTEESDSLPSDIIKAIFEDSKGVIWIGTPRGVALYTGGRFIKPPGSGEETESVIMAILEDRHGTFWFGTNNGLLEYRQGVFTRHTTSNGLSHPIIRSLHEDHLGNLWVGTQGGGVNLFRAGTFMPITQKQGLFDDVVSRILEDDAGNLWMSCNKGIFRVKISELQAFTAGTTTQVSCVAYGKTDGMGSSECNGSSYPAGWKARDGRLWFPTIEGICVIDPRRIIVNAVPPPVAIKGLVIDQVSFNDYTPAISAPPGDGEIQINYAALSFVVPEKVFFQYKLEGFDRAWVDAGNRRTAYYTNIPPGSYTFKVVASNNDGVWNREGASIGFHLEPHFYESLWFYILVGITVSSGSIGLFMLRVRQLRSRERELVKLVHERTHSLQVEKEKAESARADAELHREMAEAANKEKTELLNIAAHDLKSPLLKMKLLSSALGNDSGDGTQRSASAQEIHRSSERMLNLISDLLEAAAIESGRLRLHPMPLDMSWLASSVAQQYEEQAAGKHQTIHVDPGTECRIIADEQRLRQSMENLVSNAIKFSPPGKQIWIGVRSGESVSRFEVRDEGPGLTPGDKELVFGKFHRLSARPTGGEPSTGLGLSIAKRLVEMQNGTVRVESEYGKGSTFIIEVPSAPPEESIE